MTESREFQDGEVIDGTRYRVIRLIGVGGMGSVYEVEHTELGKRFVLKALLRELARREDLVQRLRNEWRALARLQHPNIVNVTDAGTSHSGVPYYVMERLDGDTLAAALRQKQRLHVLEAVHITAAVLDALSAAHDIGIIHRDVKPANVFLAAGGGVKLLDFGIAKIADATSVVTARGIAVGTPRYMSPEQARGERVDGRSDLYAAALILFEMIAGVGPFEDVRDANELLLAHLARDVPSLSAVVMGVSPELERIVARMLAKDCRERPSHAREGARLLRDFAASLRSTPATDAPTGQANYGAATLAAAQRPAPSPQQDSITRAEGAARNRASEPSLSDVALTRRMELRSEFPQTTQVTLSTNTTDAFSVSSVTNTTLSTPPSVDGSTTQRMTPLSAARPASHESWLPPPNSGPLNHPPVERPERTEMLGEFSPVLPADAWPTNTRVPAQERARPVSVTPPPVVEADRVEPPRPPQRARVAALGVAGLAALALGAVLADRAFSPHPPLTAQAAAPVKVAPQSTPAAPARPAPVPVVAAPSAAAVPVAPSASQPPPPGTAAGAPSADPISRTVSDGKHFNAAALKASMLATSAHVGPLVRSAQPHKASAPSAASPIVGSGL
ncbi:MAG: serine/threonine-protein kinase [Polyangiaceae bacterium]